MGAVGVNTRAYQEALKSRQLLLDDFRRWCKWPHEPTTKQATLDNVQMERDRAFGTDDYPEGLVARACSNLMLPETAIADLRTHGITSKMLAGICDIAETAHDKGQIVTWSDKDGWVTMDGQILGGTKRQVATLGEFNGELYGTVDDSDT